MEYSNRLHQTQGRNQCSTFSSTKLPRNIQNFSPMALHWKQATVSEKILIYRSQPNTTLLILVILTWENVLWSHFRRLLEHFKINFIHFLNTCICISHKMSCIQRPEQVDKFHQGCNKVSIWEVAQNPTRWVGSLLQLTCLSQEGRTDYYQTSLATSLIFWLVLSLIGQE